MAKTVRCSSVLLLISIILAFVVSCTGKEIKDITPEEVISSYEEAGYEIWSSEEDDDPVQGQRYTVKATNENGDYIFFYFFDTAENAESYAEEREYNLLLWLFSAIYGDPSWLKTKTYGNIEIEYDNKDLYEPFGELAK